MDVRRLEMLLELSRRGSMRAVAEALGHTTSTVSQQLAALAQEAGTPLLEPDGRNVRLTPAGRRLAEHAVTILAAHEAARVDLDPRAEPRGTVRVAGFATAILRSLLPVAAQLRAEHPDVGLVLAEHEPFECFDLLADDDADLALVYDYDLAPVSFDPALTVTPLWTAAWGLGVPDDDAVPGDLPSPALVEHYRDHGWIANSRNTADEDALGTIAAMAGTRLSVAHRADSLVLVEQLIVAGYGVGMLPVDLTTLPGVRVLPLRDPGVTLRAYAVTRSGRRGWPPLALVLDLLEARTGDDGAGAYDPIHGQRSR